MTTVVVNDVYLNEETYANNSLLEQVDCNNTKWLYGSMSFAFNNCTNLTKVKHIHDDVDNMYGTFTNCTNLTTSPVLPENLYCMEQTFRYCTNLKYAPEIPTSVSQFGYAFAWCSNLLYFPDISKLNNITYMGASFEYCNNVTGDITIPNSVVSLWETFQHCYNLKNTPVIPNSVTDLTETFSFCNNITDMPVIPNNVIDMGHSFQYCSNLVNVTPIPNGVLNIGFAFYECSNLVNAPAIPNSVTNMRATFCGCSNMIDFPYTIGNNVEYMNSTFQSCSNLTGNIYINSENVSDADFCFGWTSLTKNVYIPMYTSEDKNVTYHCWSNSENDVKIYLKKDYTLEPDQYIFIDSQYILDENLQQIPNLYGFEYYNYGSPYGSLIYANWDNLECNYDSANNFNVFVPSGSNTTTYESFTKAGYKTDGSVCGVYLKDINDGPTPPTPGPGTEIDVTDFNYTTYDIEGRNIAYLTEYIGSNVNVTVPNV